MATMWAVIKPMLPEATQEKVSILSESASVAALREAIDPRELPSFLDGERSEAATAVPLALPIR